MRFSTWPLTFGPGPCSIQSESPCVMIARSVVEDEDSRPAVHVPAAGNGPLATVVEPAAPREGRRSKPLVFRTFVKGSATTISVYHLSRFASGLAHIDEPKTGFANIHGDVSLPTPK